MRGGFAGTSAEIAEFAIVEVVSDAKVSHRSSIGHKRKVRLDRFKPTTTGYVLADKGGL